MADLLDSIPLEVLLSLQEAMADPTESGQERAKMRALNSGLYVSCVGLPRLSPIPMEPAARGVVADAVLRFELSEE